MVLRYAIHAGSRIIASSNTRTWSLHGRKQMLKQRVYDVFEAQSKRFGVNFKRIWEWSGQRDKSVPMQPWIRICKCQGSYKSWACIDTKSSKTLRIYRPGRVISHIQCVMLINPFTLSSLFFKDCIPICYSNLAVSFASMCSKLCLCTSHHVLLCPV